MKPRTFAAGFVFVLSFVGTLLLIDPSIIVDWLKGPPLPICSLKYQPSTIEIGQKLTMQWDAQDAAARSFEFKTTTGRHVMGPVQVPPVGTIEIPNFAELNPGDYIRTDTVANAVGRQVCSATLTVKQPPLQCSIEYQPSTIEIGQKLTVQWDAKDAAARSFEFKTATGRHVMGPVQVPPAGTIEIPNFAELNPGDYIRTDTVANAVGRQVCSTTLTVKQPPLQCSIEYQPSTIVIGQKLNVQWDAKDAAARSFEFKTATGRHVMGPVQVPPVGTIEIPNFADLNPGDYIRTDTVANAVGRAVCSATLTVNQP